MKTTIAGLAGALLVVAQQVMQEGHSFADWKTYILPSVIAILGFLSKDFNKTGV
jgi:hypothetical protein